MKNRYVSALISSSLSIAPMVIAILILSLTGVTNINAMRPDGSMDWSNTWLLLIGLFVLILGLALFQVGTETGLSKVGEYMGSSLSQQENIFIVILFAFVLGTLITCAEPSILITSKQVTIIPGNEWLNTFVLIGGIALGVGVFVVIGILRIIYHKPLKLWYCLFYAIVFMIVCIIAMDPNKAKLLPFIFDAGGVTTGSATVPFILALGAGVAVVRGGKNATNDSFGLVGLASVGPIISTAILVMIKANVPDYVYPTTDTSSIAMKFANALFPITGSLGSMIEVLIALAPILVIFFIYDKLFIHLPRHSIFKLLIGFGISYVGLVLFLSAATAVMTPIGYVVGEELGFKPAWAIFLITFVLGLVTILCEPAVHVLTGQMETISDGRVKKTSVLFALSLGVGVAIMLAAIRTYYRFSILYYMIPLFCIALLLSLFTPDIFTAMAFDSGGTASGPMSSSFILPLIIGLTKTSAENAGVVPDFYSNGFGVVALIATTPIIAIQLLGISASVKASSARKYMARLTFSKDDAKIIHFE